MAGKLLKIKSPQTMEELLASTGYQIRGLKIGETVEGKVTNISSKSVFISIGAKTDGVVVGRAFELARDFIKTLKVGDKVSAQVLVLEDDSGQTILSLFKTASSSAWKNLLAAEKKDEEIEVLVTEATRGGLLIEAYGLNGFLPTSQIGRLWQGKTRDLLGKKIKVKIKEFNEKDRRLIVSEKAVSEKERIAEVEKAVKKVKIGDEYSGTVVGLTPFGAFIKVKVGEAEVEGLVHISEISWEKIEDPNVALKAGQEVRVKVIGVDKETARLAFSLKQLTPDPWQEQVSKYPIEAHLKGKVVKLTNFGAFIEIEPGFEGLLHISKIPPEEKIEVGKTVDCFVEAVDAEKRRLNLGLVLKKKPVGYK